MASTTARRLLRKTRTLLAMSAFLGMAGVASSQTPDAPEPAAAIPAVVGALEPSVSTAEPGQLPAVKTPAEPIDPKMEAAVEAALKKRDAAKKKDDEAKKKDDEAKKKAEADKGYEVGSKTAMPGKFELGRGLVFETENKDFRIHVGTVVQFDNVWFYQPNRLKAPANVGVGSLDDGSFFRRMRIKLDGTLWDNIEFNFVPVFESPNQGFFDHMWMGFKDVPVLGTVRFGQHKVWQGLESIARNEDMAFMERSALFDTFFTEFGLGVFQTRTFDDERYTMATSFHRTSNFNGVMDGAQFADGTYAASGRTTGLAWYEDDGRYLLHLGGSYAYRRANLDRSVGTPLPDPLPNGGNHKIVRFQSRADLRDAIGVGAPAFTVGTRALQGNNNRLIDTGNIVADSVKTFSTEAYWVHGPFWMQSEATFASVDNAFTPATGAGRSRGNLGYYGAYLQTGFFLTGESRGYNKRLGYYEKVIPHTNAFFVRDENGGFSTGIGAIELVHRYEYVSLNSGNPGNAVNGGFLSEHTVGLNWHLNPNMRFMINYTNAYRGAQLPNQSGAIQGLGTRLHVEF